MNLNFVKLLIIFLAVVFSTIIFGFATGEIIPYSSPAFSGWGAFLAAIGAIGSFFLLFYQHFTVKDSTSFINIIKSNTFIILMGFAGLIFLSIAFNISNTLIQVPPPSDVSANTIEFGDLATWVAAFGTVSTLGFAIRQNNQLREEQRKEKKERKIEEAKQRKELNIERNKREEHERKQQDMWQEQRELLKVQKLQIHRKLFFEKLSEIELSANTHFEFYEKGILHDSLFNMRGISLSIDSTNVVVKKLHTAFSRINTILDSPPSELTIKELLNILHDIYRFYLYADPGEPKKPGDLSGTSCINKHRFPVINVFDIDNQISALLRSYDIICSFGNHNVDVFANRSPVTKEFKLELIRFAASRNSGNSSYWLVKDKHERLNFVICLYDIIVNDKNYNTTWPSVHKLEQLFNSSQDLSSSLHSDFKFQALLTTCKRDLYEVGEMNEQNDRIIDQLRDIITSL